MRRGPLRRQPGTGRIAPGRRGTEVANGGTRDFGIVGIALELFPLSRDPIVYISNGPPEPILMKISKRTRQVMVVVGFLGLAALGYFVVWPAYRSSNVHVTEDRCAGHGRFDATVWKDTLAVYSRLAPRGCMVDDLLAHHKLVGLSRTEVIALLGEDPQSEYFSDYDFVYWLGPKRGLTSKESEWLVMRFGESDQVIEARLVTG
jgi:hypothetical protein